MVINGPILHPVVIVDKFDKLLLVFENQEISSSYITYYLQNMLKLREVPYRRFQLIYSTALKSHNHGVRRLAEV